MRARRAACATVAIALGLVATACGSASVHVSRVVSVDGAVGPLRIDHSDRAQVVAYAGKPDVERHGRASFRYDVLGYGCLGRAGGSRDYLIHCRTSFYLVRGTLALFYTRDPRYSEAHGIPIGTTTARAERRLHRLVEVGCGRFIWLSSRKARLTLDFGGGRARKARGSPRLVLLGGHVDAFYLHSLRRDPGVTDCA